VAKRKENQLTIVAGGKEISGWEQVELTLRAEGFPGSFDVAMSAQDLPPVKEGDDCKVLLGDDVVVTGYVDRYNEGGDANSHLIQIMGRGKTQDLVDCSAEWPNGQVIEGDALSIAQKLCRPYGITVQLANGAAPGPKVPGWALNYGDTAADIIQRLCRNAGLLAYEDSEGKLLLAKVGSRKAASGAAYGANVQSWTVTNAMDDRFSEIVCANTGTMALLFLPGGDFYHTEKDPNVRRHRQRCIVLDPVGAPPDVSAEEFTVIKAKWEVARRAGRATIVRATVDSWRDKDGKLWSPNTLVPFALPGLRLAEKTLVLSEVSFRRDGQGGTTAALTAMPREAFVPEPITLQPVDLIGIKGPNG